MHELQELVDVVTRNKVKSIRLLEPFGDQPPDMLHDFYARLANHQFANDEEAAQFYGYTSASDRGYRKQRDKLRERLYNSAVFIDVNSPKFDDAQKAHYTCYKNLITVKFLLGRNARNVAIALIHKTLKFSTKYEISEVTLELYTLLRRYHATRSGDLRSFKKYSKLVQNLQNIVDAEKIAALHGEMLSFLLVKNSAPNIFYLRTAKKAIDELSKLDIKSSRFVMIYGSIICQYYRGSHQYMELQKAADNTITALRSKSNVSRTYVANFKLEKLISYVKTNSISDIKKEYTFCRDSYESGTVGWFNTNDVIMIYFLGNQIYQEATGMYKLVTTHPSFKHQSVKRKETWKTYEAYIYYLLISGKIDFYDGISHFRYSINKFLNEVPMLSMDKGGYNIPIVVIQNLLLIKLRQYEELTTRTSALEKYCKRYIKRNDIFRSHYFFKLLLLVPKCNFDRDVIKIKAKPYLKKLESVPLSEAKQSFEIEIIPYETLWEYVLESLD